MSEEKEREKC